MKKSTDIIYDYEPLWGSWTVEEFVGEGNFGRVYKVSRAEWDQKYISAVKVISIPQNLNDYKAAQSIGVDASSMKGYFEGFVKNIVSEIELMYKLKGNSNIVSYEDHMIIKNEDEIGWHILIKMEFVQSLTEYIAKNETSVADVLRLGIDICKALETCEKQNIIHRDIKDDNIFISKDGNFKLGDFGIAKELSKSERATSMRGTPLYMAPEVYKGENYDSTVDTYSLGIVMYKLLNKGRLPFVPSYPDAITYKDTEDSIDKRMLGQIPKLPADAENEIGELVLKAFSYDPLNRFKSPNAMRQALQHVISTIDENNSVNKTENIDISEDFNKNRSFANRSLGPSVRERNGSEFNKTVSIFNKESEKYTNDHNENVAIFKNIKNNYGGRNASTENIYFKDEDLNIENGDLKGNIKEGSDIIKKYIPKPKPKKNSLNTKKMFVFIGIGLIVVICSTVLMLNNGNKDADIGKNNTNISEANTKYYEQAKKAYEDGYYDSALELVTQALKQNPKNAEAICLQIDTKSKLSDILLQEGMTFLKEKKLEEAQASFEDAVRMFKPNTEAQKQLDEVNKLIKKK